jgi:DNA-binding transcriptional regulator YiaG
MTPGRIRLLRHTTGLSQRELARVLRLADRRTVQRWEAGEIAPPGPVTVLLELIEAGALPASYFLRGA